MLFKEFFKDTNCFSPVSPLTKSISNSEREVVCPFFNQAVSGLKKISVPGYGFFIFFVIKVPVSYCKTADGPKP